MWSYDTAKMLTDARGDRLARLRRRRATDPAVQTDQAASASLSARRPSASARRTRSPAAWSRLTS